MQRRWDGTDAEKYRKQAIDAAETARDAAERAADAASKAARTAKEWAEPRVKTAKEWAVPRVENTWAEAKEWATPKAEHVVQTAAKKAKPYVKKATNKTEHWVEVAQGAIVGAAIPAVLSAFDRAADEDRYEAPRKGGSTLAKVLIPVLIAGAAGAALVMWAKRNPTKDGWAGDDDEWEFEGDDDFPTRLRRDVNKAADATAAAARRAGEAVASAASMVAEQAGPTYAKAKDATVAEAKRLAEQAGPYVDKAKEQATPYVDKAVVAASTAAARAKDAATPVVDRAKEVAGPVVEKAKATAVTEAERLRANVEAARHRAAVGLADTLDDAEDVWEDEGGPAEDAPAPAAVKKPRAPRKPAAKKTAE